MSSKKDVDKAIEAAVDNNASVAGMVNELLAYGIAEEDEFGIVSIPPDEESILKRPLVPYRGLSHG